MFLLLVMGVMLMGMMGILQVKQRDLFSGELELEARVRALRRPSNPSYTSPIPQAEQQRFRPSDPLQGAPQVRALPGGWSG